jgi:hypothetical protein
MTSDGELEISGGDKITFAALTVCTRTALSLGAVQLRRVDYPKLNLRPLTQSNGQ